MQKYGSVEGFSTSQNGENMASKREMRPSDDRLDASFYSADSLET